MAVCMSRVTDGFGPFRLDIEDCLLLLPQMEDQRYLRKTQRGAERALADLLRQKSSAQCGHRRLAGEAMTTEVGGEQRQDTTEERRIRTCTGLRSRARLE